METLIYLLKVNIAFVILIGAYRLLLRAMPLFAANRAWLLLAPVVAFALPLITIPSDIRMGGVIQLPGIPVRDDVDSVEALASAQYGCDLRGRALRVSKQNGFDIDPKAGQKRIDVRDGLVDERDLAYLSLGFSPQHEIR